MTTVPPRHGGDKSRRGYLYAALAYAGKGWRILPCRPTDKSPYTSNGLKDATANSNHPLLTYR